MLLLNIQRARAQYKDMLSEAEARRLIRPARLSARLFRRPKRDNSLIAYTLNALRRGLRARD